MTQICRASGFSLPTFFCLVFFFVSLNISGVYLAVISINRCSIKDNFSARSSLMKRQTLGEDSVRKTVLISPVGKREYCRWIIRSLECVCESRCTFFFFFFKPFLDNPIGIICLKLSSPIGLCRLS